mmetsp:Transcript_3295/g.11028  ORF Transcript_3295/g.11028 Transcript_3295/m.11028 type:complete len:246 (+) Transcript_3295:1421-2158(+)
MGVAVSHGDFLRRVRVRIRGGGAHGIRSRRAVREQRRRRLHLLSRPLRRRVPEAEGRRPQLRRRRARDRRRREVYQPPLGAESHHPERVHSRRGRVQSEQPAVVPHLFVRGARHRRDGGADVRLRRGHVLEAHQQGRRRRRRRRREEDENRRRRRRRRGAAAVVAAAVFAVAGDDELDSRDGVLASAREGGVSRDRRAEHRARDGVAAHAPGGGCGGGRERRRRRDDRMNSSRDYAARDTYTYDL